LAAKLKTSILFSETLVFEIGGEEFLERETFLLNEFKM